ncbi:MBL fold metallo-hydrolase [Streptomyces sp. NPDC059009]|uniref:MBL fold metallo-hydrolase n=1 Tax=Streptomyces sp. NPDC059009 TaxID=3346694 RepID=UPI00367D5BB1
MDVIEIAPRLHLLRFPVGQAYLWRDGEELTLVDAGPPGAAADLAAAVTGLGRHPRDVRRVVLTHFHEDHMGGAAAFAALSGAEVVAHRLEAPVVRGEVAGPEPVYEGDWERSVHANAKALLPQVPVAPVPGVREVADGEVLDFGGGARVVHTPGHTDGSIGLHLPSHGVLFTGDAIAVSPLDGQVILGVLNVDRERAVDSFGKLAGLDAEVACFGHGDPVTERADLALRAAYRSSTASA